MKAVLKRTFVALGLVGIAGAIGLWADKETEGSSAGKKIEGRSIEPIPPSAKHAKIAAEELSARGLSPQRLQRRVKMNEVSMQRMRQTIAGGELTAEDIAAFEARIRDMTAFNAASANEEMSPTEERHRQTEAGPRDLRTSINRDQQHLAERLRADSELLPADAEWVVNELYKMPELEGLSIDDSQKPFVVDRLLAMARTLKKAKNISDPIEADSLSEVARTAFLRQMRRFSDESLTIARRRD